MNIHEHQAKILFKEAGMPTVEGRVAFSVDEAVAAHEELGGLVVVKSQVHVGGRGKAGGVKLAKTPDDTREAAEAILGLDIKGHVTKRLYIEKGSNILKEAYLAVILDRSAKNIGIIASAEGGMDIEEVAENNPDAILRINTAGTELPADETRAIAEKLFGGEAVEETLKVIHQAFDLLLAKDATQVEINPLALTDAGVICLDGKMNFDGNALFRQPDVVEMRDMEEEDANEIEAKEKGLAFIQLDGDIGCMVNGAGLAMATLDMITLHGGKPANFLDVGGSSNPDKVVEAFKFILASGRVKSILINIFGGITRCDDIAKGILTAMEKMDLDLPIVVRLAGTNAAEGTAMLEGSSLIPAASFGEAVKKAVELGKAATEKESV